MKLTIETNEKKFFRQLLEILSSIPPLNKLRPKELDLLAIIMYYNNIYKDLDPSLRQRVLNSKATKKEIRDIAGMNENVFNTNIFILRKNNLVSKSGELIGALQIFPKDSFKIEFQFNIEKNV
jgi:hypothetical protein